jgi:hypothetical protein
MDIHESKRQINRERTVRPFSVYRLLLLFFFPFVLLCLSVVFVDRLMAEVKQTDHPAPAPESVTNGGVNMPLAKASRTVDAPFSATGRVVDDTTNMPLKEATVTLDNTEVIYTDNNGAFPINHPLNHVGARALGYTRAEIRVNAESSRLPVELRLKPIRPKALYLTVYGESSTIIRGEALKLVDETELNALVLDMKGDRGVIPYKSDIALASAIGAQSLILIKDIRGLIQSLKAKGIYTIARIVVSKDNILGSSRPDLAIKTAAGEVWRDRENLIWVDLSKSEVWNYNIAIAVEAARNGFDEIQFDYVRFPDHKGLRFGIANTEENRVGRIVGFLSEARKKLLPYNVFLSADIFGYVAWNFDDTQIGQRIDRLTPAVDYISLMLYPSGFHLGIPGYKNPVANVYEIVYLSLKKAQERTHLPSLRFRPWLQAFRDYAFDRRLFTGVEIRKQIKAAEDFGSDGWMLWNPRNSYTPDGLKKNTSPVP